MWKEWSLWSLNGYQILLPRYTDLRYVFTFSLIKIYYKASYLNIWIKMISTKINNKPWRNKTLTLWTPLFPPYPSKKELYTVIYVRLHFKNFHSSFNPVRVCSIRNCIPFTCLFILRLILCLSVLVLWGTRVTSSLRSKNKTLNNGLDNMFTLNTCCTLAYQMGVTQNKSYSK